MRKPKGSVSIDCNRGMLRLRLPRNLFGGTQQYLYLGLPDSPINRKAAESKAQIIESEIAFERFDFTLERYKPKQQIGEIPLDLHDLWENYTDFKTKILSSTSIATDYRKVRNHIGSLPPNLTARQVRKHLMDKLTPTAAKKVMMFINGCCQWAVEEELIEVNPYINLPAVRTPRISKSINPFSVDERDRIIQAFEAHEFHQVYANFVKFLFFTGCRPSEAIALNWHHVTSDYKMITFSEAVVLKNRKDTKTHTIRKFPTNQKLESLLRQIHNSKSENRDRIFSSPNGYELDGHNFQNRAWKEIMGSLPIVYRSSYNTRHTFITICLENEIPVTQVAAWVGNSAKTIWSSYAGLIATHNVPEN